MNIPTVSPPPPGESSVLITSIESSVQDLIKITQRRRKYDHLFNFSSISDSSQPSNSLTRVLESNPIRIITIFLLTLDLILTILELSSSIVRCPEKEETHSDKTRHRILHPLSTAILVILLAKSLALAIGLGAAFFKSIGNVLDGAILIVALVLDVWFESSGGSLIVVVSLWRVVRIVESSLELDDEAIERKIEVIMNLLEVLKQENSTLENEVEQMKDKLSNELQQQLVKNRDVKS